MDKWNGIAANINECVSYQEKSIVSKKILHKETGTITLFAFDKGEALSEHTTPYDALLQIIDGEAEITISGRESKLTAGEMILLPANQPHAVYAAERFKMILTMIK